MRGLDRLARYRANLANLADMGYGHQLQGALGDEAVVQYQLGIDQSRDPYGVPYEALKTRVGKPLDDTGAMRNGARTTPSNRSFVFTVDRVGFKTHQRGATITPRFARALVFRNQASGKLVMAQKVVIPRRQMVPEERTGGLGKIWLTAFERVAKREARAILRRGL